MNRRGGRNEPDEAGLRGRRHACRGRACGLRHHAPAAAAAQWARDRLFATGGPNLVRVTVQDASVVEVPLKRATGIGAMFTTEQTERYDGVLDIRIDLLAPDGRNLATVTSRATRSTTTAEDLTLLEREKVWFRLTEAMMNDINASLERQIKDHFANWIRS